MILVVVAILILVACGGYFGYQKYQEYLLSRETDKIGNLDILNDKEKNIIIKRYGLYGSDIYTQKDIANELKISRSYVSRIEKRALIKLYREFYKKN